MNISYKNKIFLFTIILILIFFLLIIGLFRFNKNKRDIIVIQEEESSFNVNYDVSSESSIIKPLDIKNCDDIVKQGKKDECIDNYFLNKYVLSHDLKGCVRIYDLKKRDECIFLIAKQHEAELNSEKYCQRIVDKHRRNTCLTVMSRYRPYELENNICQEVHHDEPFEQKECLDRNLAMQIYDMINDEQDLQKKKELLKKCSPDLALEYGILCISGVVSAFDRDCSSFGVGVIKNYCEAFNIFRQDKRTESDCNSIKLDNHRKVCLKTIETQKTRFENDSDDDGFSDGSELFFNIDPFNSDTDGDGIKDGDEVHETHTNPASYDTDGDGLNDFEEVEMGTNPQKPDTDGDGIEDKDDDEPIYLFNDTDQDRLSDELEKKWGTDPNNKDTDGDGIDDYIEAVIKGTNPLGEGWRHDTDDDGLINADERFYFTDIFNPDTDNDGFLDGAEVESGYNPNGDGLL
ncbi:MAG: hypothetical protein U9Q85_01495 [Patescibacteria group bacterium]|nr:hypothetical protein [Patescibacteria group bacterium]